MDQSPFKGVRISILNIAIIVETWTQVPEALPASKPNTQRHMTYIRPLAAAVKSRVWVLFVSAGRDGEAPKWDHPGRHLVAGLHVAVQKEAVAPEFNGLYCSTIIGNVSTFKPTAGLVSVAKSLILVMKWSPCIGKYISVECYRLQRYCHAVWFWVTM